MSDVLIRADILWSITVCNYESNMLPVRVLSQLQSEEDRARCAQLEYFKMTQT
jgi:hypothetical protein